VATTDGTAPLDAAGRAAWLARHEELASAGLRVLALADKRVEAASDRAYTDLTLVALVGMEDPPRREVARVIDQCRHAGIRVVMVTGDHPATAGRVAQAVGLASGDGRALSGAELDRPQGAVPTESPIFARTSPQQKLELIRAQRRAGHVVAMIGDGVNDAPALHEADIGVAMGGRGTQVAKEAADMVLLDDRLDSIVVAIHEGRAIFDNIRRFVVYLLSCNVSELLSVGVASLLGLPLPVLPMQILFLNLVTDVFPALALGACPPASGVMTRPPRPPGEPTLTRSHWRAIGGYGALLMATVLGSLWIARDLLGLDEQRAVTVSFVTLGLAQTLHVFNMRGERSGVVANEVTKNAWVWGAIVLCTVLVVGAVFLPGLSQVLGTASPGTAGWLLVGAMSVVPVAVGQVVKAAARVAGRPAAARAP
jgi:Ca2+-transporting ATPase